MTMGLLLAALTGLCWASYGIALSFTARGGRNVVAFGLVQNLLCATVMLVCFGRPTALCAPDAFPLFAFVFCAGFLNAIGQGTVNWAMTRGHNGIVWALSQSSMVLPFLVATICFAQPGVPRQWGGVALIMAAILLPVLRDARCGGAWRGAALLAFLAFGTVQSLYMLPSQLGLDDGAHFRPVWAALGNTAGWLAVGVCSRRFAFPDRAMLRLGAGMAVFSVVSLTLFFAAADRLQQVGVGNIAVPLMTGTNIFAFALFSLLRLREQATWREWATVLLLLGGLAALA